MGVGMAWELSRELLGAGADVNTATNIRRIVCLERNALQGCGITYRFQQVFEVLTTCKTQSKQAL